MFLLGYLLSGLANAGIGEDPFMLCITSPKIHIYKWGEFLGHRILNVHKIFGSLLCNVTTLSRNVATSILPFLECRDIDFKCLCNVAKWIPNDTTSILTVSVTSRCGFPTSRRRFLYPLERRDVSNQRHDVDFYESL